MSTLGTCDQPEGATERPGGTTERPITIAVLAMGGEGGGVLADWLVALGEAEGYAAQMTSVPGVAQRTGATIYYIELFKPAHAGERRVPVLAMMPAPGEVDVVIASELMEAGRAVQRELVSVERTTLITSTHRVYSMTEKMAMGDGRVDSGQLLRAVHASARRLVAADFAELARQAGTVISAPLFGALAGAAVLPFSRSAFEATIRASGVGVQASLAAFVTAFERTTAGDRAAAVDQAMSGDPTTMEAATATTREVNAQADPLARLGKDLRGFARRLAQEFPAAVHETLIHGLVRLADYQDTEYASTYLDRLQPLVATAKLEPELLEETARHLALWMSYEDTIRVADLKTRSARFERVAREQRLTGAQLLEIREFMHPRVEEFADTLPAGLGRWLLSSHWLRARLAASTRKGRVVATHSMTGFLMLYLIGGLRRWRRGTLRFANEDALIREWLDTIVGLSRTDWQLALEVARLQRLVKGYGDTHARGTRNYRRILQRLPQLQSQANAAARVRELTHAALADETGVSLDQLLTTH